MTVVKFAGQDMRWLFETLVEACEVATREGERPDIEVNGKIYSRFELLKVAALLPDEALQPHHQIVADEMFKKHQSGYRNTASNLAHRANETEAAARQRRSLPILAAAARKSFGVKMHPSVPDEVDVAVFRKKAKLTQQALADHIGVSLDDVRGWERGSKPRGPALVLLALLARNPKIIEDVLGQSQA